MAKAAELAPSDTVERREAASSLLVCPGQDGGEPFSAVNADTRNMQSKPFVTEKPVMLQAHMDKATV